MSRAILAALLLTLTAGGAGAAGVGTGGAQFLTIEQGARSLAMGGAFTAAADGADALWWNPAGIARAELSEVTLTHTSYLDNVSTEYLGYLRPVPSLRGSLGASVTYMNVPGVDGTDASGNPTGTLKTNGTAAALAYGASLAPGLTAGASGKYVSQTLGPTSGSGFALDLGVQYRADDFGAAASFQNLGPSIKVGGSSDPLPRDLRAGVFYKPRPHIMVSLDGEKPYDSSAIAHLGGEYMVSHAVRLRAGYEQTRNAPGAGLAFGIGLAGAVGGKAASTDAMPDVDVTKPLHSLFSASAQDFQTTVKNGGAIVGIDYAFVAGGSTLNDVHRITLNIRF